MKNKETVTSTVHKSMRKGTYYNIKRVLRLTDLRWFKWWVEGRLFDDLPLPNYESVRSALRRMVKKGIVKHPSKGIYVRIR